MASATNAIKAAKDRLGIPKTKAETIVEKAQAIAAQNNTTAPTTTYAAPINDTAGANTYSNPNLAAVVASSNSGYQNMPIGGGTSQPGYQTTPVTNTAHYTTADYANGNNPYAGTAQTNGRGDESSGQYIYPGLYSIVNQDYNSQGTTTNSTKDKGDNNGTGTNKGAGTNNGDTYTPPPDNNSVTNTPTPFTYTPTNNMPAINSGNDANLKATIEAIKAAVQQAKNKQQQIIQQTPEQYNRLKDVVFNQSLAGLPAMNENIANLGASSQGGFSRTEQQRANSTLMNNLAELDRQKQQVIDDANFAIADLEAKGQFDEANATAEAANNKLQQILAESARLDNMNYQIGRDTVTDARYNNETAYNHLRDTITDSRYNDETAYQREQDRLANEFRNGQFDWQKEQSNLDRAWQQGQFDYQKARDLVSDSRYADEWKQKLDEWTFTKNQQAWDNEFKQGTFDYQKEQDKLSQQNYDNEFKLKLDEYAWSRSENNPAVKAQILNNKGQELQNSMLELEKQALPAKQAAELAQIKTQTAKMLEKPATTEYEQKMQKLDLEKAQLQVDQIKAETNASKNSKSESYQNYLNLGLKLNETKKPSEMTAWVKGLSLSADEKAQLANDLGIPK